MIRLSLCSLILFAVALVVTSLPAQDEDAFGKAPAAATEAPHGKAPKFDKVDPLAKPDLIIESIRDANPSTPEALTRALQTLLDYGEPKEAKLYLGKLVAAKPDQGVLLELHRKFGAAFFMQLGRDARMAPEGAQLSRAVLDMAHSAARDPKRLAALVEQLKDLSEDARRAAVVDLHDAGQRALPPLLTAFADNGNAEHYSVLRDAMLELNELAIEPLIGALESPDEAFRARVIDALGRLRSRHAVLQLVGPYLSPKSSAELKAGAKAALLRIIGDSPTQYDAEQFLARRAKSHLQGESPRKPSYLGYVELWHWDDGQKTAAPRRYLAEDAALFAAARAAADLHEIAPQNPDYRRLYLTAGLQMQKMIGGLDQPLPKGAGSVHAAAAAAGVPAVEDLLKHALRQNYAAAAVGACEVLGDIGTPAILVSQGDLQSPLTQALRFGDRRVRFAAAEAALRLDPRESYAGSSHVMETLGYVVRSAGVRRALVVHPQSAQAQSLVGLLNGIGFEADAAATGKRGFQLASEGADYELVLISDLTDKFDANELFQMLRRDPRTARLPVGLMYRGESKERMERIADDDPLSHAMPRPHSPESAGFEVTRLLARSGRLATSPQERLAQASIALDHLKRLADRAELYPFYDLLRQQEAIESALQVGELSDKAAFVLGRIGSPLAQRALAGLASQSARPVAERQAAAAAFGEAVKLRGTLLTTVEIRNQYDLYNKSETSTPETQAVLASLLDAIEKRAQVNNPPPVEEPKE